MNTRWARASDTSSDFFKKASRHKIALLLVFRRSTHLHFQCSKEKNMSNHFTGLSLGPPLGDQRLDLCDLYAFPASDPSRTVLILNANPQADALHPDAIYRLAIDNDGDLENDIAFSYVFSTPKNGKQTVDVFMATGEEARSVLAVGTKLFSDVEVSFEATPNIATSGDYKFFAGA